MNAYSASVRTLIALGRHIGVASLAGVITGIVVGGLLGRVIMRVSGFTAGPALVGVRTSNGNRVGDITLDGTLGLVLFVGVGSGLVGGVLFAAVEPWLRRLRPWHGLAYGVALFVTFGFVVLDPSNVDFRRFGFAALNLAMFAALFIVFGVLIAWLFDRLRATIGGTGVPARATEIVAWLALAPAVAVTALVAGSTGLDPPLTIFFVLSLLIAAIARWRRLPPGIGYVALALPLLAGAARTVSGVTELVAGF